jgi:nucleotide-binding universal stress UspA family protein
MFQQILIPLDGSTAAQTALPAAISLATTFQSDVELVHVLSQTENNDAIQVDPLHWHMRKAEVETYLTTAAQMFSSRNIRVKKALLEGAAAERIVAHAAAQESDLIVLSSHGQSGVSGWNVSSVAQKVITRANRSILLMRAFQQGPVAQDEVKPLRLKRLLVPLDGSKRAEGILPVACKLAAAHRATLWLVHVATFTSLVRPFQEISEEMSLDKITSQYHEAADSYLQQTGSQLECMTKSAVIEGETVIGTLNRFVEEEAIDLMLLSAHG